MSGLTSYEVQERVRRGEVNVEVDSSTSSVKDIVKENVFTYFNLVFTVLAILLVMVGSFKDLSFMLIIFANTGIGIFQEIRSKNTLDALRFGKMPGTIAVRDGEQKKVPTEELVLDDLVILSAGDQIPADADVVEGVVSVNESLLTGEADEVEKKPGYNLLSGSYIVSGRCMAVLTAVGQNSYINKLTIEATRQGKHDQRSNMVKNLDRLVMLIGILIIPIGAILMIQQMSFMGQSFRESVIAMVAAILGMIPEGLFMMTSIALAVSAVRLAKQEVLVQNMKSIETLARVDVLCVDKTGTITENRMQVANFKITAGAEMQTEIEEMIGDLVQNMDRDNITMEAMQSRFTLHSGVTPKKICPFSSAYKYCGAVFDNGNLVLGAPEFVLGTDYARYESDISSLGSKGYRVLAFGETYEIPQGQRLQYPIKLLAIILLNNPVRAAAPETFEFFEKNGVDVKVISGDNPVTVSNVAKKACISGADLYVDAGMLTDDDIDDAVKKYTVFGRVTPKQKRLIVRSLKNQGRTVAMTGDGVNDILALRDADCSVAMASGSEAASNAAQMVLMDSDFSRMPSVVAEGRRVVNNIIKTASLYLTKNIFSFLLATFSMVSVLQYPLQPSQLTLISLFTIGLPSFVLSLEQNKDKINGSFLGKAFKTAMPAGITIFASVSVLIIFGQVMSINHDSLSTAAAGLVALGEFLILGRVARPITKIHFIMMTVMVTGFFYAIIFHSEIFGISPMNWQCALLLIVFLGATESMFRYFYMLIALFSRLIEKARNFGSKSGSNLNDIRGN